jgi:hypothetical protein
MAPIGPTRKSRDVRFRAAIRGDPTSQNAKRTSDSLGIGCDLIPPGYPLAALLLSFPAYAGDDGTFMLSPRWGKSTTSVSNSVFI